MSTSTDDPNLSSSKSEPWQMTRKEEEDDEQPPFGSHAPPDNGKSCTTNHDAVFGRSCGSVDFSPREGWHCSKSSSEHSDEDDITPISTDIARLMNGLDEHSPVDTLMGSSRDVREGDVFFKRINQLEEEAVTQQAEVATLNERLTDAEVERDHAKAALTEADAKSCNWEARFRKNRQELHVERDRWEQSRKDIEADCERAVARLRSKVDEEQARSLSFQEIVDRLELGLNVKENEQTERQREIEELRRQLEELAKENAAAFESRQDPDFWKITREKTQLENRLADVEAELTSLQLERDRTTMLERENAQMRESAAELQEVFASVAKLKEDHALASKNLVRALVDKDDLTRNLGVAEEKNERLQVEIDRLIQSRQETVEEYEARLKELSHDCRRMQKLARTRQKERDDAMATCRRQLEKEFEAALQKQGKITEEKVDSLKRQLHYKEEQEACLRDLFNEELETMRIWKKTLHHYSVCGDSDFFHEREPAEASSDFQTLRTKRDDRPVRRGHRKVTTRSSSLPLDQQPKISSMSKGLAELRGFDVACDPSHHLRRREAAERDRSRERRPRDRSWYE